MAVAPDGTAVVRLGTGQRRRDRLQPRSSSRRLPGGTLRAGGDGSGHDRRRERRRRASTAAGNATIAWTQAGDVRAVRVPAHRRGRLAADAGDRQRAGDRRQQGRPRRDRMDRRRGQRRASRAGRRAQRRRRATSRATTRSRSPATGRSPSLTSTPQWATTAASSVIWHRPNSVRAERGRGADTRGRTATFSAERAVDLRHRAGTRHVDRAGGHDRRHRPDHRALARRRHGPDRLRGAAGRRRLERPGLRLASRPTTRDAPRARTWPATAPSSRPGPCRRPARTSSRPRSGRPAAATSPTSASFRPEHGHASGRSSRSAAAATRMFGWIPGDSSALFTVFRTRAGAYRAGRARRDQAEQPADPDVVVLQRRTRARRRGQRVRLLHAQHVPQDAAGDGKDHYDVRGASAGMPRRPRCWR